MWTGACCEAASHGDAARGVNGWTERGVVSWPFMQTDSGQESAPHNPPARGSLEEAPRRQRHTGFREAGRSPELRATVRESSSCRMHSRICPGCCDPSLSPNVAFKPAASRHSSHLAASSSSQPLAPGASALGAPVRGSRKSSSPRSASADAPQLLFWAVLV